MDSGRWRTVLAVLGVAAVVTAACGSSTKSPNAGASNVTAESSTTTSSSLEETTTAAPLGATTSSSAAVVGATTTTSKAATGSAAAVNTATTKKPVSGGTATTVGTIPPTTQAGFQGMQIDYKSLPSATLNASGSTFQAPFQEAMIAGFQQKASKVTVNYGGGGSGKGKTDLVNGVVDYAGTDSLLSQANKDSAVNGEILYFPIAAAPITVSFNVKGVTNLQLSPATVAKIFQVQIKNWNDPAIAADNPGASLPSTAITVAHRSDGSGTTNNFTGFLTKAAAGTWTLGRGDTVNWDPSTQAGNGNRGVAQIVQGTDGAIGYVDYADALAANLKFASIKNHNGRFQAPTLDGVSAALDATTLISDLTYDPLDAVGDAVYPIATPTWMLVYKNQSSRSKGQAIQGYLNYILTDGQKQAKDLNYAPLPEAYRQNAITHLTTLNIAST